jgi:hypothetical protein
MGAMTRTLRGLAQVSLCVLGVASTTGCGKPSAKSSDSTCTGATKNTSAPAMARALRAHTASSRELALGAAFWAVLVKSDHERQVDQILLATGLVDELVKSAAYYPTSCLSLASSSPLGLVAEPPKSSTVSLLNMPSTTGFQCGQLCLPSLESVGTAKDAALDSLAKGTIYDGMWKFYSNVKTAIDSARNKGTSAIDEIASTSSAPQSAWVLNTAWNVVQGAQVAADIAKLLASNAPTAALGGELGFIVALAKAVLIQQELRSAYITYKDCMAFMEANCNCSPACPRGQYCIGNICTVCASDGYCNYGFGCTKKSDCRLGEDCYAGTCASKSCDQFGCPNTAQCIDGCGNVNPTNCACSNGSQCVPLDGSCKSNGCAPSRCVSPGYSCLDDCSGINPALCGCAGGAPCLPNGSCPTSQCDTPSCPAAESAGGNVCHFDMSAFDDGSVFAP